MTITTRLKALLLGGTLFCTLTYAHVHPQTQTPAANAQVQAPSEVKIEFDGPLEPAFSTLSVSDAGGRVVSTAKSQVDVGDKRRLTVALPSLPPGKYTVHWVAVAADGHRTQGAYSFSIQ